MRAEIDNELTAKSIDFMKPQHAASRPFFLCLPFSMGHSPNYPSSQFKGKSRIGDYRDKMMEGDFHVGEILDALKELGIDDDTILIFASDNGPSGDEFREFGNQGHAGHGQNGPFRGNRGEATEGSIRTCTIIRWPGHVKPDATHARLASSATDRPIDGVDQSDVLFGNSAAGHRESMLSLIGPQLMAVRWKQWRFYLTDMHPTGSGPQRLTGTMSANSAMGVYPKVYNIEMDPHENLNVIGLFPMVMVPALAAVRVEREAEPLFRHGGPAMEPRHAPILATIPPPAQYAATFFAGVGRDRLMQWRPAWLTMEGIHWAGVALAFAGFILAFVSAGCFVLRRTTLNPAGQPAHLVVRRAHAWSRNPMYLSLAIIYAGVALALGKAWPLVLVVLPWAAMNWVVNPFDEARLKRGFSMPEKEIVATPRHPA